VLSLVVYDIIVIGNALKLIGLNCSVFVLFLFCFVFVLFGFISTEGF
jgi:hypothetical protein